MNKFDLEERLIEFSVLVIEITKEMPNNYAANHLAKQLLCSGTSVSLNYGEAQSGENNELISIFVITLHTNSLPIKRYNL